MNPQPSKERGLAVALTGGMACGKSTVGRYLAEAGAAVLDTDEVGHALLAKGSPVLARVVDALGPDILDPNGEADRGRIARLVFSDREALGRLNAVMHPAIMARVAEWVGDVTVGGRHAVVMVPLLYEIGAERGWDAVICVVADEAVVRERLRARGWSEEMSSQRMAAQWPVSEKARRATLVIENNGTLDELKARTAAAWKRILEKE
jgi:dephospho-CoA kinase